MADANTVMDDIEILRDKLSSLINIKGDLLDPEVLNASILLDDALNAYNKLYISRKTFYITDSDFA